MEEILQDTPSQTESISPDLVSTTHDPLCNLLLTQNKLTPEELKRSRELHLENGISMGILLVRSGLVSERDMVDLQQKITGLPVLDDKDIPEVPMLPNQLPQKFLQEAYVLPLDESDENVSIAMADPSDNFSVRAIELACNKEVKITIASTTQIENAIERLFGDGNSSLANIVEEIESNDEEKYSESTQRLKDMASEAPIIRLVSLMINRAINLRASDIHIEPFENQLKIRYRIDGILQEAEAPPVKSTAAIISRIKIMAKLNIAERRLPQDGRIQLRIQGKLIDFRISTVPTLHGESLVLRILDRQHIKLDFDALGFATDIKNNLRSIIRLSYGIILVTGPTGSGKTTTLYTALQELNTQDKKILTVEDPVEYQLDGINQIQVKPQIGLNFADALRSIVRQDPDIIMIGEMRDFETASIAVQSALTGHLVFSTLHTNNVGSSITRLLDIGVADYLLTSTLNGILSQRLIRTLCDQCREVYSPLPELIEELSLDALCNENELFLYKSTGCEYCQDTGYVGRNVITEFLTLSESIRRLILSHADGTTIQNAAIKSGMDTMQIDGIKKALQGIATIEDIMCATQEI